MDKKTFCLKVISPDRIFYEGDVEMVELTTTEGEIGVYADHVPTTAVLSPGILSIYESDDTCKEAAVYEGFIEILQEQVTIMAQVCEWPNEIDVNRANEAKVRAERLIELKSADINLARAEFALRKSLVRIELARDKKRVD